MENEKGMESLSEADLLAARDAVLTIISYEDRLGDVIDDKDKETLRESLRDIDNELKSRANEDEMSD